MLQLQVTGLASFINGYRRTIVDMYTELQLAMPATIHSVVNNKPPMTLPCMSVQSVRSHQLRWHQLRCESGGAGGCRPYLSSVANCIGHSGSGKDTVDAVAAAATNCHASLGQGAGPRGSCGQPADHAEPIAHLWGQGRLCCSHRCVSAVCSTHANTA